MIFRSLPYIRRAALAIVQETSEPIIYLPPSRSLRTGPNYLMLSQPSIETRITPLPLSVFPLPFSPHHYSYQRRFIHHSPIATFAQTERMLQEDGKGPTPPSSATTTPNITLSNLQKALILTATLGSLAFAFHWTRTNSPDQRTEGDNSLNQNQSGTGNAQSQQTGGGDKQSQQSTGAHSPIAAGDQKINSGSGTFTDNSQTIGTQYISLTPPEGRKKKTT